MDEKEELVDLSLYKIFLLVCQNGSFSKTAKILNLTQPSVSYSIKKLESELGVTLFERGNILTMTPEAEELLPYVEEALNSIRKGEKKLNDLVNLKRGQISVGIPSHIGVFLLTDIMKKFNKIYPNVKFQVICKPTKELFRLLSLNELDILIDSSPLDESAQNFIVTKIAKEKCAFACNYRNKELLDGVVDFKKLLSYPLIVPLRTSSSTKSLINIFDKNNLNFDPSYEISTTDMIVEMIDQNMGIGFIFEKTISKYDSLRKIDVNIRVPEFDIFLLHKENLLSTTAQTFIKFIKEK